MPATISTDLASVIYAKVIESLIVAYQYDDTNITNTVRYRDISGVSSPTASFPRDVKSASVPALVASETTALPLTTLSMTSVDLTVARYGIARSMTNTAIEDTTLGSALYISKLTQDTAILFGELLETSVTAQFVNATAVVGVTNTVLTVATLVSAVAQQRVNKAKGKQVIALHDFQLGQLQASQVSANATTWSQFYAPNADNTQYGGIFMNCDVWASGRNPTANAAADVVGSIYSEGTNAFSAYAFVSKRMPSSLTQTDILSDNNLWASFARFAFGTIAPNFATRIQSKNAAS